MKILSGKLAAVAVFFLTALTARAQSDIQVEAPDVVGLQEQFNVTFIIEGDKQPSDFQWSAGSDFQLVWGPQRGVQTSTSIINGKRTRSSKTTFSYILLPKSTGSFTLPAASAKISGDRITSAQARIEVVADEGGSTASGNGGQQSSAAATGDIPSDDLFMRLNLSRTDVVTGEPITATLKLYQRVSIAGFEDAKFPTFNGFWSQETVSPSNIEFRRESLGDKIYDTAILRGYVIIPQQAGDLVIDPAELVVLVNVRVPSSGSSIFDSFFDDGYRRIRKRISTPAARVHVRELPSGAPASFSGGVGSFTLSVKAGADSLNAHEATSLTVTVSGKGNVSLLQEPKINFPPDIEVYDVKATENTDRSSGGTSGSKIFEYPIIPRSHGNFTIGPVEYSYYDVNQKKYVTLVSDPVELRVGRGKDDGQASSGIVASAPARKDVRNLSEDIRFISTRMPSLGKKGAFYFASPLYWAAIVVMLFAALGAWLLLRKRAERMADVAGSRNRRATKMALGRLRKAGEYLEKNLHTAFYEELHRALLGFASDKLGLGAEDLGKDKISETLTAGGAGEELAARFTSLLDQCEFARYSPEGGSEAMKAHYDEAVEVISAIDFKMRNKKKTSAVKAMAVLAALSLPWAADAASAPIDSLWNAGVQAYQEGRWSDAVLSWETLEAEEGESARLSCNIGDAYFKAGDWPRAILNYERALKLNPSDTDSRFNLELANSNIQDKIEVVPEFFLEAWGRKACYLLSSNTWAVLSLIFLAAALVLLLVYLLSASKAFRKTGFFGALVCGLVFLLCLDFSQWQYTDYNKADSAIVMSAVASVKSSPSSESAKDLFILHEGTKVRILDEVGLWLNIELSDGRQGWIPSSDIEVI